VPLAQCLLYREYDNYIMRNIRQKETRWAEE